MAAAWTRESEWSWVIAQPTKQEERIVEIVAPFPKSKAKDNIRKDDKMGGPEGKRIRGTQKLKINTEKLELKKALRALE